MDVVVIFVQVRQILTWEHIKILHVCLSNLVAPI